jgi:hypothetical protein
MRTPERSRLKPNLFEGECVMKLFGKSSNTFSAGMDVVLLLFVFASHVASTTRKFAYVVNESSNNISTYTINSSTGAWTTVSGSPFTHRKQVLSRRFWK